MIGDDVTVVTKVAAPATVLVLKLVAVPAGTSAIIPIIGLAGTVFASLLIFGFFRKNSRELAVPQPTEPAIIRPPNKIMGDISADGYHGPTSNIMRDLTIKPSEVADKFLERPSDFLLNAIKDIMRQPGRQEYTENKRVQIRIQRKNLQDIGGDVHAFDVEQSNLLADHVLRIAKSLASSSTPPDFNLAKIIVEGAEESVRERNRQIFFEGLEAAKKAAIKSRNSYAEHIENLAQIDGQLKVARLFIGFFTVSYAVKLIKIYISIKLYT